MEAKPIAIKQLLWDEANTVYELDDPPTQAKQAPNKSTLKMGKRTKTAALIKQPQMNQKVNRPTQSREVYKS